MAGGLGERLGYSGIKLELPPELLTSTPYLELYAKQHGAEKPAAAAAAGGYDDDDDDIL